LFADHQACGRGTPMVRGPKVENRCPMEYGRPLSPMHGYTVLLLAPT